MGERVHEVATEITCTGTTPLTKLIVVVENKGAPSEEIALARKNFNYENRGNTSERNINFNENILKIRFIPRDGRRPPHKKPLM